MQHRVITFWVGLVLAAGCGSRGDGAPGAGSASGTSGGGPERPAAGRAATFTLSTRADVVEPPGGVKVTAQIPAGWTASVDGTGAPSFELPGGGQLVPPTIVLIHARGDDDAARIGRAIGLQFDERELAAAAREDLSAGRVWIAHTGDDGRVHARMFVPAPDGVVMCAAMLGAEGARHLAAFRAMCDTVAISAP